MKKLPTESEEQIQLVQWLKRNHPGLKFFAIPNGGYRAKKTAAILKAEGVCSGVPDLFFPSLFLFIEMKRQKGGVLSDSQKQWIEYLGGVGYECVVCLGYSEAKNVLEAKLGGR